MIAGRTPTVGVEEEFHLVDADTRRLTPRAEQLLGKLPDHGFVEELQRCVVEVNSGVFTDLEDLRRDLERHRRVLSGTARELGLAVAAAGTMPLSVPDQMEVTETPRYRRMLADYQLLAREQLICGCQVHVEVPDRDEAVQVAWRVAPYLPYFLALTASSPFSHDGTDTGYASSRSLVWSRWPTSGPAAMVADATEYDRLIADLVRTGVISDAGMVYFDVRPSAHLPTVELRVCDSTPSVDIVVLVAGLFRAVVQRGLDDLRAGRPAPDVKPTMLRAGLWQAARSGLEGGLVDLTRAEPGTASELIPAFVERLRPQLEASGDWELVRALTDEALFSGTSAFRQRRALRQRGRLADVVDLLTDETAGRKPTRPPAAPGARDRQLLHGYQPAGLRGDVFFDEAVTDVGAPRPGYAPLLAALSALGPTDLRARQHDAEHLAGVVGATFKASGSTRAEVFPVDILPRIIEHSDWQVLVPAVGQRALALNHFIDDVYGPRQIIRDQVIPSEVLDRAPGFRQSGYAQAGGGVRNHVTGLDLVCTGPGRWVVMEDNLRVPSGIGYAVASRTMTERTFAELLPDGLLDPHASLAMIRDTLLASAPPNAADDVTVALVSSGPGDSAWYEHRLIAEQTGIVLVDTADLVVVDGVLHHDGRDGPRRIDVLYARMDEDMLLTSTGHDGAPLRHGLLAAVQAGHLTIANSLGNGVGDDKAVYAYVPAMIEYYLGEAPLLPQIPTLLCAEREQRDHVVEHLHQMVVKPIDGYGGAGITIGPEASDRALDERRRELEANPERYVAQEIVPLSTHPTFDGTGFYPHHVDLRAFVHLRPRGARFEPVVVPACLSRVARRGTLVVNSSQGGGGKDTWIVTSDGEER